LCDIDGWCRASRFGFGRVLVVEVRLLYGGAAFLVPGLTVHVGLRDLIPWQGPRLVDRQENMINSGLIKYLTNFQHYYCGYKLVNQSNHNS